MDISLLSFSIKFLVLLRVFLALSLCDAVDLLVILASCVKLPRKWEKFTARKNDWNENNTVSQHHWHFSLPLKEIKRWNTYTANTDCVAGWLAGKKWVWRWVTHIYRPLALCSLQFTTYTIDYPIGVRRTCGECDCIGFRSHNLYLHSALRWSNALFHIVHVFLYANTKMSTRQTDTTACHTAEKVRRDRLKKAIHSHLLHTHTERPPHCIVCVSECECYSVVYSLTIDKWRDISKAYVLFDVAGNAYVAQFCCIKASTK